MTDKPVVVIIPGSYCPAYFYWDLKQGLSKAGYEVDLHDIPTASGAPGIEPVSLTDDGKYFHTIIESLANQNKDIVVLAHSYGGSIAREAIHGLSKVHRQNSGQSGGVVQLIYLSTMFMKPGETGMELFAREGDNLTFPAAAFTEPVDLETPGGPQYLRHNPIKGWSFFFGDMSKDEGVKWLVRMSMQTMATWTTAATDLPEDEKKIPVTFVKCLKDKVFPIQFQANMIEMLKSEGSNVGVKEIDSAHMPNISCPDQLLEVVLDSIAGQR